MVFRAKHIWSIFGFIALTYFLILPTLIFIAPMPSVTVEVRDTGESARPLKVVADVRTWHKNWRVTQVSLVADGPVVGYREVSTSRTISVISKPTENRWPYLKLSRIFWPRRQESVYLVKGEELTAAGVSAGQNLAGTARVTVEYVGYPLDYAALLFGYYNTSVSTTSQAFTVELPIR